MASRSASGLGEVPLAGRGAWWQLGQTFEPAKTYCPHQVHDQAAILISSVMVELSAGGVLCVSCARAESGQRKWKSDVRPRDQLID